MTAAPAQVGCVVEGPPDPDLIRIRDLIYAMAGIFHPDNKLCLLSDRCRRRMKEVNSHSLSDYLDRLCNTQSQHAEMIALLNEISIGETRFFRNQQQLDAVRQVIVPKILNIHGTFPTRKLRIWSAGCSTGEEPYTVSMMLREEMADLLNGWTVEIVATDINERSLAYATNAAYDKYSMRNVKAHYQKYFTVAGDQLQVSAAVRAKVKFSRLNLSDDLRMALMRNIDIIFCCNVLIYFDLASKRRVIEHFFRNLLPHGYLLLGQSESLYGVNNDFQLVHMPGATAYVKRECAGEGR